MRKMTWAEQNVRNICGGYYSSVLPIRVDAHWSASILKDFTFVRDWREVSNYEIKLIVVQCHGILFLRDWLRGK